MNKCIDKKSKIAFVVVKNTILVNIDGSNSNISLWNYRTGILTCMFSVGHILKCIPVL